MWFPVGLDKRPEDDVTDWSWTNHNTENMSASGMTLNYHIGVDPVDVGSLKMNIYYNTDVDNVKLDLSTIINRRLLKKFKLLRGYNGKL